MLSNSHKCCTQFLEDFCFSKAHFHPHDLLSLAMAAHIIIIIVVLLGLDNPFTTRNPVDPWSLLLRRIRQIGIQSEQPILYISISPLDVNSAWWSSVLRSESRLTHLFHQHAGRPARPEESGQPRWGAGVKSPWSDEINHLLMFQEVGRKRGKLALSCHGNLQSSLEAD